MGEPLVPFSALDTFTRTLSADWGTSDTGAGWTGQTTNFSTNGIAGVCSVGPTMPLRTTLLYTPAQGVPAQALSSESLSLLRWTSENAGNPHTFFGPTLNHEFEDQSTFYYAALEGNDEEISVGVYVNGSRIEFDKTSKSLDKNEWYWVRFQRTSKDLRVRVWAYNFLEPTGWTLEAPIEFLSGVGFDQPNPQSGLPGFFFKGDGNNYNVEVDTFYYYTFEDEAPHLPVADNFTRSVHAGWGVSDSGHAWQGNFSDDPNIRTRNRNGVVTGGFGLVTLDDPQPRWGVIGPDVSQDIEAYFEYQFNSSVVGGIHAYFGVYGNWSIVDSIFEAWGYALRVGAGGTNVALYRKNGRGASWVLLATSGSFSTLAQNVTYSVRIQKEGSTLRAKIWQTSVSEPVTWTVTTTDSTSGMQHGQCWFEVANPSSTRTFRLVRAEYKSFTPSSGTAYTQTGTPNFFQLGSTHAQVYFPYTFDSNNNNLCTIKYRRVDDPSWITVAGTQDTANKIWWSPIVTGLEPDTQYIFQGTFSDPDIVVGANPVYKTILTFNGVAEADRLTTHSVGTTTATAKLTYKRDSNNNATATLFRRTLGNLIKLVSDPFADLYNGTLDAHTTTAGQTWAKHPSSAANIRLYRNRAYLSATASGQKALYTISEIPPTANYYVDADFLFENFDGSASLIARCDPVAETFYMAGYYHNDATEVSYWRISKVIAGVETELCLSDEIEIDFDRYHNLRFDVEGTLLRLFADGVEVCSIVDSSIASVGKAGIRFTATLNVTSTWETYPRLDNFALYRRGAAGSWTSLGTMTAAAAGAGPFPTETHRYFYMNMTGLASDSLFELRADLSDADGVYNVGSATTTLQTFGNKSGLDPVIETVAYPTSISATFHYEFDANNDASLVVQFKAAADAIWTTLPASAVTKNNGTKTFRVTPTGLKPATTYEFRGTLSDPDGILEGYSNIAEGSATTKTLVRVDQKLNKRYVWKIYDNETGEYIESWHDAGAPEFSYQQNGGVSDLTVRLRRPISVLHGTNNSIEFFNRVDVWVHDTYASGLGPNLIEDENVSLGSWTLGPDTIISGSGGVDGGKSLKINTTTTSPKESFSEPIYIDPSPNLLSDEMRNRTFIISVYARAKKGKLVLSVEEYRDVENSQSLLARGDSIDTVGTEWQLLRIKHRIQDPRTEYIRILVYNDDVGTMWVDTPAIRTEEMLLYSGHIEQISPKVSATEEWIDVQVLGDAARLSDTYVEWLQYVTTQGTDDFIIDPTSPNSPPNNRIYRENRGPAYPQDMIKDLIEVTNQDNPKSRIYWTATSIKDTGDEPREYTFKEIQVRASFDKVNELAPSGFHYFIEPDGLVWFRGNDHVRTHVLRIGVEATNFEADFTIRNLKNYVHFKGRQDDDFSEPDGHGSITAIAFDQKLIDLYGKRMIYHRDARVKEPRTADTIAEGKLDELDQPEQRSRVTVLDEKTILDNFTGFKGYNIESFRPGDLVVILNPRAAPEYTYWDQAVWDESVWNSSNNIRVLTEAVPIKTIQYHDTHVILELSERPPSSVSDFGRMLRIIQKQQADGNE